VLMSFMALVFQRLFSAYLESMHFLKVRFLREQLSCFLEQLSS